MPTVGVKSEISLSTEEARTQVHKFYKSISVKSSTVKTMVIPKNQSGLLDLTQSDYVIIAGLDAALEITLTNLSNQSTVFTESGFLMVNASNLKAITILNNSAIDQEVTLMF